MLQHNIILEANNRSFMTWISLLWPKVPKPQAFILYNSKVPCSQSIIQWKPSFTHSGPLL